MQTEESFLTEFKEGNWNGLDTSLEWTIVFGQRRFFSEHRTVGEEEDHKNNIKSQTPPLGAKCKHNNQFEMEFKKGNWNGLDTFLEWKTVFGQRRITSGHRTLGGEEEDHNNYKNLKHRH